MASAMTLMAERTRDLRMNPAGYAATFIDVVRDSLGKLDIFKRHVRTLARKIVFQPFQPFNLVKVQHPNPGAAQEQNFSDRHLFVTVLLDNTVRSASLQIIRGSSL